MHLDKWACLEESVYREILELKELLVPQERRVMVAHQDAQATQESQEQEVCPDLMDVLETTESQDLLAHKVTMENQDHPAPPDCKVSEVAQDFPEPRDQPVSLEGEDLLDLLESEDLLENKVEMDPRVWLDPLEHKVPVVMLDPKELLDLEDQTDKWDLPEQEEPREREEFQELQE